MFIKAKLEALIYAAEDPITLDQMAALLKDDLLALKTALAQEPTPESAALDGAGEFVGHDAATAQGATAALANRELTTQEAAAHSEKADSHLGAVEQDAPASPPAHTSARHAAKDKKEKTEKAELRAMLKPYLEELIAGYESEDRGIEVRQVAGGYRMSTKPEHHDVVRAFSKSLKPPIRLSLQALETLAVVAYKQPVTVPEIGDIRGVDTSGVIGTLLERKLITTAGRKAVVGRPMLYKTTKDFLLRFGLKDLSELPSLEEFEKLAAGEMQDELFGRDMAIADATGVPDEDEIAEAGTEDADGGVVQMAEDKSEVPQNVTEPTVSSDPRHTDADEQVAGEVASESTGG
jgi:segregation and condensation protein B